MTSRYPIDRSLRIALVLCAAGVSGLLAQSPRPDAKALDAAQRLRQTGSPAASVAREMLSSFRQTGPQTLMIMTATGYAEAEIGRALATEARADAGTMASWAATASLEATSAWQLVRSTAATGVEATRALIGSGFRTGDLLLARQSVETRDIKAWATDLRNAGVGPVDAGEALSVVTAANARVTAEEMLAADYSVVEVAVMLRDTYDLSDVQVGQVLLDARVDEPQVLVAWIDPAYGLAEPAAVDAFLDIGGRADHAASILRDRGRNAAQVVSMLHTAGYTAADVGDAIDSVFGLPPGMVVDAMVSGGMDLAAAAFWADHDGQPDADIVNLLEAENATATENAQALLLGNVIQPAQYPSWSTWARAAGYTCTQTTQALKDAFGVPSSGTVGALTTAGCSPGEVGNAIDDVYGPSFEGLALLLVQAGFNAADLAVALHAVDSDPLAVAEAMHDAGTSMNDIAGALHDLGITPARVAEVLMDVFNPAPLALAMALKLAGFDQPEVQAVLMTMMGDMTQVAQILAQIF